MKRFLTKEEFIQKYGENWKNHVTYGWSSPHMDNLFGQPENRGRAKWTISEDMLTDKPLPINKEELLEEAKRRYPIGTKFKIAHKPEKICTVLNHELHKATFVGNKDLHINLIINEEEREDTNSASVYSNGKWAEIVSLPSQEVESQEIEVGDLVECINNDSTYYKGSGWKENYQFIVKKIHEFKNPFAFPEKGDGVYNHSLKIIKKKNELEKDFYKKYPLLPDDCWELSDNVCTRCVDKYFGGADIINLTIDKNEQKSENIISKTKNTKITNGKSKQGNCIKIQRSNSSIRTGNRRTGTSISGRG